MKSVAPWLVTLAALCVAFWISLGGNMPGEPTPAGDLEVNLRCVKICEEVEYRVYQTIRVDEAERTDAMNGLHGTRHREFCDYRMLHLVEELAATTRDSSVKELAISMADYIAKRRTDELATRELAKALLGLCAANERSVAGVILPQDEDDPRV